MADYSMLSPFLVPEKMRRFKAVNIGDGFIAQSIADLLRPHHCRFTFANREPLLGGMPFSAEIRRIVVTVTERGDFWDREKNTIDFVSHNYRSAERVLSLHQVFPAPKATPLRGWKALWTSWRRRSGRTPQ